MPQLRHWLPGGWCILQPPTEWPRSSFDLGWNLGLYEGGGAGGRKGKKMKEGWMGLEENNGIDGGQKGWKAFPPHCSSLLCLPLVLQPHEG